MKAVNLIPGDSRRGGRSVSAGRQRSPAYALLAALAVLLGFVTIYVLTSNAVSQRKAKVATLQAEVVQARAAAARLSNFTAFEKLAQTRAETVREIATARFDWHKAFEQLSKVVPANTSLQTLTGTVAPGAGTEGSATASGLRSSIAVPAIELTGCTQSQDDVARLMSRLRLIDGVTRVTLSDSQKSDSAQSGASVSSSGGAQGCGVNAPSFDLVVFFTALPDAGPSGVTGVSAQPVSTATGATK